MKENPLEGLGREFLARPSPELIRTGANAWPRRSNNRANGACTLASCCGPAFNTSMHAPKPSISLSAANLGPSSPELGTPDLTEHRISIRSFPRDTAESDCYRYLLEQMQAAPDRPRTTRAQLEMVCRRRFHVTVETFDYCWHDAIKATGARWNRPGRRPR